ncbi:hypothetical protein U1Q18_022162 [Sarracenia purpurea var. burkii]
MVFSSVPIFPDPPNWHQQPNQQHGAGDGSGGGDENNCLSRPVPPPSPTGGEDGGGGSGTATGSIKPGSMADRARLAKLPQPEPALKCPRCESTNTKFCYFNNYSLTQPRHFCKTCRRYWTRGGALRNVPVGGGCRRNKKRKRNRSRSPSVFDREACLISAAAAAAGSKTDMSMISSHLLPPPPQLPLFPFLPHLSDYGSGGAGIGLNFGGIQPPVAAASGNVNCGTDMEFHIDNTSCGGGGGGGCPILSARFSDHWRLQQQQQFPFLTGLEPPSGIYPFDQGDAADCVDSYVYAVPAPTTGELGSKPLDSGITQLATVKTEENRGLNFLGLPGNYQYWGGSAWTDLSGFTSSSTTHIL